MPGFLLLIQRVPSKVRVAVDDKVKAAPKEAPKEADSKGRGMVRDRKGMIRFKLPSGNLT